MAEPTFWGGDVRVSMPLPSKHPILVPMFGFGFTPGGMAHDISEADYTRLSTPTFTPTTHGQEVVHEDAHLDRPDRFGPPIDVMRF